MIHNISYAGGGVKGYTYIGVIKYLEEIDMIKEIKGISGSSIGSIIAILQTIGYSSDDLKNIASHLDLTILQDFDIKLFIEKYGLDNGDRITKLLEFFLITKGVDKNVTFKQLYEKFPIKLVINCFDIQINKEVYFDYLSTPNVKVVYASRCSIGIPLIWTPVDNKYIDGCFGSNLPIEVFPVENTVGFYTESGKLSQITSFDSYLHKVIISLFIKGMNHEVDIFTRKGYKLVKISTEISAVDIHSIKKDIDNQIKAGYEACSFYLQ